MFHMFCPIFIFAYRSRHIVMITLQFVSTYRVVFWYAPHPHPSILPLIALSPEWESVLAVFSEREIHSPTR